MRERITRRGGSSQSISWDFTEIDSLLLNDIINADKLHQGSTSFFYFVAYYSFIFRKIVALVFITQIKQETNFWDVFECLKVKVCCRAMTTAKMKKWNKKLRIKYMV